MYWHRNRDSRLTSYDGRVPAKAWEEGQRSVEIPIQGIPANSHSEATGGAVRWHRVASPARVLPGLRAVCRWVRSLSHQPDRSFRIQAVGRDRAVSVLRPRFYQSACSTSTNLTMAEVPGCGRAAKVREYSSEKPMSSKWAETPPVGTPTAAPATAPKGSPARPMIPPVMAPNRVPCQRLDRSFRGEMSCLRHPL